MKKFLPIMLGIVICLAVGVVSSLTQGEGLDLWYPQLEKSPLNPPNIVFPIVWSILYVAIGISVGILYNTEESRTRSRMLWIFGIQLFLNFVWNLAFFYMRSPTWGLVVMPFLVGLAIWYFCDSLKISRSAAWLFLPYTLWMFFATYLNLYVVLYN